MTDRVAGKVALVTGAGRGQGRSHAVNLAREGADIIAVDICRDFETISYPMSTAEDLARTVKEIEALDRRAIGVLPYRPGAEAAPGGMAYSWAKRTLVSFVHDLGLTLASHSIRINGVHPTNVNTDMLHHEDMYRAFRPDLENPTKEDAAPSLGTLTR